MTKLFKIPATWAVYAVLEVEAQTLEEAVEKAGGPEVSLPEGCYIEDSFEPDDREIINEMNKNEDI